MYSSNYELFGPGYSESGYEEFRYTGKREDGTGLYYYGARALTLMTLTTIIQ